MNTCLSIYKCLYTDCYVGENRGAACTAIAAGYVCSNSLISVWIFLYVCMLIYFYMEINNWIHVRLYVYAYTGHLVGESRDAARTPIATKYLWTLYIYAYMHIHMFKYSCMYVYIDLSTNMYNKFFISKFSNKSISI